MAKTVSGGEACTLHDFRDDIGSVDDYVEQVAGKQIALEAKILCRSDQAGTTFIPFLHTVLTEQYGVFES